MSPAHNTTESISATASDEPQKPTLGGASKAARDKILLTDEWNKQVAARSVPGAYWDRDGTRYWVVNKSDLTPRAALVIFKLFPDAARRYPAVGAARDRIMQDVRPFDNATKYNRPIGAPNVRREMEKQDD